MQVIIDSVMHPATTCPEELFSVQRRFPSSFQ